MGAAPVDKIVVELFSIAHFFLLGLLGAIDFSQFHVSREKVIETRSIPVWACGHPLCAVYTFGIIFLLTGIIGMAVTKILGSSVIFFPLLTFCLGFGLLLGCVASLKIYIHRYDLKHNLASQVFEPQMDEIVRLGHNSFGKAIHFNIL
jgi:hypothetical protein